MEFLLGIAASLVAAAVDRILTEQPGQWKRRRIDRRVESMTDAVMQPMIEYFEREGIDEETTKRIAKEAEKPVRSLIENGDEIISRGLDASAITSFIFENKLDKSAKLVAEENPAAFDVMLRAYVDLAVRTPPLFADWEQKQFTATYKKLEELEEYLARIYGDMQKVSTRHARGEELIDRIIVHEAGRLALKMSMHGLRSTALPQTDIDNLFILPHFSIQAGANKGEDTPQKLSECELRKLFTERKTSLRYLVVAPAGAGKTTWIEWLSSQLLNNVQNPTLPVNIRLRQLVKDSKLPTLLELVQSAVTPVFHDKFGSNDVENWLSNGKLFLLLDGFDEVPERERDEILKWIEDIVAVDNQLNVTITSRPLTTSHHTTLTDSGYQYLSLEPFDKYQVEEYIGLYQKYGPPIQTDAQKLAPADLAATWRKDPTLGPLTSNPLLLSTLLAVHHMDGELPQGRAALYERYVDGMLGAWETRKELSPPDAALTKSSKRRILEIIAVNMIAHEVDAIDEDEAAVWITPLLKEIGVKASVLTVLENLRERSGLLIGPGQYSFAHKSIGEFLIACACNDGVARDVDQQRYDRMLLTRKCKDDRWFMVVFLWAGIAPANDVQLLIEDLYKQGEISLASGLLIEFGDRLDPNSREDITWRIIKSKNDLELSATEREKEDGHTSFYISPLPATARNINHCSLLRPVTPTGVLSNTLSTVLTRGWINPSDWNQHIGILHVRHFLDLSRFLGFDRKLAECTSPAIDEEEQIIWLTFWHIFPFKTTDLQIPFELEPFLNSHPDAVWRGVAMCTWVLDDNRRSSDSDVPLEALEKLQPSEKVCADLCNLKVRVRDKRDRTWSEHISVIVQEMAENSLEKKPIFKALQQLDASCKAWKKPHG